MFTRKIDLQKLILQGNDNEVLAYLYKSVLPKVRSYVLNNSGNKDEADDIFQDAVLIFYNKVMSGEAADIQNIEGYIFFICKNLWINRATKQKKNIKIDTSHEFEDTSIDSLHELINSEKNDAYKRLFNLVGDKCKELLTLAIYNKLSMIEIAKKMNLSNADAAKTQHYRCKQKLAELVEHDVILKSILKS